MPPRVGAYAATMNILPGPRHFKPPAWPAFSPSHRPATVETCDTAGILNTAVNLAASIQATEALKFLVGAAGQMRRTLLAMRSLEQPAVRSLDRRAPPRLHRLRPADFTHLRGEGRPHITLCGRNSVQIHEHRRPVDFAAMQRRLEPHGAVRHNSMLLRFERGEHTITLFADGRALIQGTTDVAVARSLYARFIGS